MAVSAHGHAIVVSAFASGTPGWTRQTGQRSSASITVKFKSRVALGALSLAKSVVSTGFTVSRTGDAGVVRQPLGVTIHTLAARGFEVGVGRAHFAVGWTF